MRESFFHWHLRVKVAHSDGALWGDTPRGHGSERRGGGGQAGDGSEESHCQVALGNNNQKSDYWFLAVTGMAQKEDTVRQLADATPTNERGATGHHWPHTVCDVWLCL